MILHKFQTDIFAGIANQEINFSDGLNIILGKNEAGKSTIINAIYATLFQDANIRLNYSEDKSFYNRYFPYPDGDYIHGYLEFEVNSDKYVIEKEWSREEPKQYLKLPDGSRIKSEDKINNLQKQLFKYGKGSYNNIVFTKQRNIKSSIKRIIENDEVINTVNNFLRRAVMELDGVSIDKLTQKVNNELDDLTKKWDIENNRPSNPDRDANNPYKMGYGKIYEAYIEKEQLRKKMNNTEKIEKEFEEVSKELKEINTNKKELINKVNKLAEIEDDIFERGQIEPEIKSLKERINNIKEINKKWPVVEARLADDKEKLEELNQKLSELKIKKKKAEKNKKYKKIKDKLKKIEDKKKEIDKYKLQRKSLDNITKNQVNKLSRLKEGISKSRASLEAAKMKVKINFLSSFEMKITTGVEDTKVFTDKKEFEANGYFRLIADDIDFEIESAEIDFNKIQQEYKKYQKDYEDLSKNLGVNNLEDARNKLEKLNELNNKIKNTEENIQEILDGEDYNKLLKKIEEYDFGENLDDPKTIENKINDLKDNKITELKINIRNKKDKIKNWKEKYDSQDNLMDRLLEIRSKINKKEEKLSELTELPKKFSTPTEFKNQLSNLRKQKEKIEMSYNDAKERMLEIENKMDSTSYEELEVMYKERQKEFAQLVSKAKKIIKIKDLIQDKLNEMDQNSLKPLVESFSNNLKKITANSYNTGKIDDNFKIKIKNENNFLPAQSNFLSYGTYDGVALSLRLALFDNLFKNKSGFIILDDCLVNLDPERRDKAIDLIKRFKNNHQVIFSTCNPETAHKLGGNIIKL